MRSASRRKIASLTKAALFFLAIEAVTLGPLAAFARLLDAEGPLALLFAWTGAACALLALSVRLRGIDRKRKTARRFLAAVSILAGISCLTGIFAVVVQVSVAHRSLAEAWLELARGGHAFGFFSFFAAELYALFLLVQGMLLSLRRYPDFAFAFVSTTCLCAGIILDSVPILGLCILAAFLFFVVSGARKRGGTLSLGLVVARLRSVAIPCLASALVSITVATCAPVGNARYFAFDYPDFSAIFVRIAPSFPLLRDVPGYGFSAGAAEMPNAIYLSQRTLFTVTGEPNAVYYLATERYRDWDGEVWLTDPETGDEIPVTRMARDGLGAAGSVRLALEEDFTPTIPIAPDTTAVVVSDDASETYTAFRNTGIRFVPSVRRGFRANLVSGDIPPPVLDDRQLAAFLGKNDVQSARIASLAQRLRAGATSDRDYIRVLLDFFSKDYTYSLKTAGNPGGKTTVESFIFTGKTGFCLYFASAFVLLAREGGVPARIAEGYRVTMDEFGEGVASGNNAHAWPEALVDGQWRVFEPTPPFATDDPFAYVRYEDRKTRRQLEALFGNQDGLSNRPERSIAESILRFASSRKVPALAAAIAILVGTLAIFAIRNTEERRIKRRARAYVRRYRRKGIATPDDTGWLAWIGSVESRFADADAAEAARKLIAITFAPR